ncbi:ComEA family DNA-binding protein [Microbacterium sp. SLBN-146]|uniref:ComEA family DNA-binding protein n=1 Tax=Microbacterium sp. SLBN-146 TaxID=2768457 RepID=UPI001153EF87|nr:ComEA family DNA-binding protein [Microbacterium sp. SLBN-146]TQJ32061.1 competence protein ComEA [Microbacterium sp. SLBN-146]
MASDPSYTDTRRRLGVGALVVLVLVVLAATVGIGILRSALAPVETISLDEPATLATAPSAGVYVHVSGAVEIPGLYVVAEGSRVVDAVAAAGGFTDEADADALNLARPVSDGEQIIVLAAGEAPAMTEAGVAGDGRVNLNTADLSDLDTLPRVGPAIAQRIIEWRESNGRFSSVDDLLAIPGIGDKMLESFRDLVTV